MKNNNKVMKLLTRLLVIRSIFAERSQTIGNRVRYLLPNNQAVSVSPGVLPHANIPYSLKFSRTKNFVVCQISLEKVIFVIKFSWISCSVLRIIFKISVRAPRE